VIPFGAPRGTPAVIFTIPRDRRTAHRDEFRFAPSGTIPTGDVHIRHAKGKEGGSAIIGPAR
jgi:hypothetical protein